MRTLSFMSLMLLAACNGGDPGDTSGTTGDGGSDGGGWTDGSAKVTLTVYRLGVETDVAVTLKGVKQTYTATSGETVEVLAPDQYTATSGDGKYTSQFGYPVHTDDVGEYWATAPLGVEVEDGAEVEDGMDMFKVFEPGTYSCSYDKYEFDASAEDKKGEYFRTTEIDPQHIAMDQHGVVQLEEGSYLEMMGPDDQLYAEGEHLALLVGDTDYVMYITTSEIGKNRFSLTRVSETTFSVVDLSCTK